MRARIHHDIDWVHAHSFHVTRQLLRGGIASISKLRFSPGNAASYSSVLRFHCPRGTHDVVALQDLGIHCVFAL